ncbi:unnamed protein product [Pieris brassicae]|uniref:Uncharacterized protein n=1 Tax=Pieris brassicae TaxID=7116 RepID=A0A9P0TQ67_PIEBR|nr:unnamed protein product [Pieris brassicae]
MDATRDTQEVIRHRLAYIARPPSRRPEGCMFTWRGQYPYARLFRGNHDSVASRCRVSKYVDWVAAAGLAFAFRRVTPLHEPWGFAPPRQAAHALGALAPVRKVGVP